MMLRAVLVRHRLCVIMVEGIFTWFGPLFPVKWQTCLPHVHNSKNPELIDDLWPVLAMKLSNTAYSLLLFL